MGANETNPSGFFESRWAVDFHKDLTRRALIDASTGHRRVDRARGGARSGPRSCSRLAARAG